MDSLSEQLADELVRCNHLDFDGYMHLIAHADAQLARMLAEAAVAVRKKHYGNAVFVRGLIEVSSYCRNNCYYCGIRAGNSTCERYRLTADEIAACADVGYDLGFRTFVLQGGEDPAFDDEAACGIISALKAKHPDCAVTLSLGERTFDSYRRLKEAGADRYLLRHETADADHYAMLHPANMSHEGRMERIRYLREAGFAVGVGMMVGSPGQTSWHLAKDLQFIEEFKPEMCGIGPFVPHHATPFADKPQGSAELTCLMLSLIRLVHPTVLLPATTALGTIAGNGRERGILAGANVVMPNLSPFSERKKYSLYDGKAYSGSESAQSLIELKEQMARIGYEVVVARGDVSK